MQDTGAAPLAAPGQAGSWGRPVAAAGAGLVYGCAYAGAGWLQPWVAAGAPSTMLVEGVLHMLVLPLLLWALERACANTLVPLVPPGVASRHRKHAPWTGLVWVPAAAIAASGHASTALTLATLALQVLLQAGLLGVLLEKRERAALMRSEHYLASLFLLSGFAALIYQVAWQRILFTEFGVNSESVTAIVSVFMFGLGVGALAGGWLQKRFPDRLLHIFIAIECGIGLYGAFGAALIHAASPATEPTMAGLVARVYAVLALPTLLMGATLPVLIAHLQKSFRDIGRTVSLLYALNTFGSAIASFATVQVLFVLFGLRASIAIAVLCNLGTAFLVYRASRHLGTAATPAAAPAQEERAEATASAWRLPYPLALAALAAVGYISLSLEILWFRLLGFMTASRPEVFGMLLAVYLAGIGWGSLRTHARQPDDRSARRALVRSLLLAAAVTWLTLPVTSWTTALAGKGPGLLLAYAAAGAVAFWCGAVFPTLVHLGTRDRRSDAAGPVTWLYFANIVGAALGPLLTGFVLLDRLSLADNMALLAVLTLALAAFVGGRLVLQAPRGLQALAVAALAGAVVLHPPLAAGSLERLLYASAGNPAFRHVLEDRSAIIAVEPSRPDIMYGHGIFDGRFNTDPVVGGNGIERAYLGAALHPAPRRVLEIGLSTGSWTRVFSSYEPVQEIVVVEIGRGYPQLVRRYPEVAPVLDDPRIRILLDDGRRWLKHHPEEKFDFILMNTSFPWRANMTNLLSREFLELARSHLNPGGIVYYNALGYDHVAHTAAHVFRHVSRYQGFVAASDAPLATTAPQRRERLLRFRGADGRPVFARSPAATEVLETLAATPLPDVRDPLLARRDLWLITDDNMSTEFKVRY
ncbi:hypothetical protein H8N03_10505 [Ramlibacter sp. USB13]|uniref:PABS domain-containing protein n=1 Tax=Ramlibacter cellulosilyticus TaxID=2764187 RepID=A0A923MQJ8_9BURK|nr:methyltransferase domain-containing protein [Ramlibacter cellulosilyticus]MBC5783375.1 hypothetical protein [Ramlibacter cellulosilyticus]